MSKENYKFFTEEEDRIIIENYPKIGSAVADMLEDRTKISVLQRARRLGLSVIKEKKSDTKISREKKAKKNIPWSKEEDYQIRKHRMEITEGLLEALPDRSYSSIEKRIWQLRNQRYVSSEICTYVTYPLNVYVDVFGTYKGYDKLHINLEISIDEYLQKIIKANPDKKKFAKAITEAFIMKYRDHLPTYDISRELNISEESVEKLIVQCIAILKRTMIKNIRGS